MGSWLGGCINLSCARCAVPQDFDEEGWRFDDRAPSGASERIEKEEADVRCTDVS
jgi:hypothetical protein